MIAASASSRLRPSLVSAGCLGALLVRIGERPSSRVLTCSKQLGSFQKPLKAVQLKELCSSAPYGRNTDYSGALQGKVISPAFRPGIEERNGFASLWIDRAYVAPFASVAERTGESKIAESRRAAVLLRDNMVSLVSGHRVVLVNEAVFATFPGSLRNSTTETCGRSSAH